MSRKHEVISDAAIYSSLAITTQFVTLLTGIFTRKFLGPVQMGVWSLLQIILVYSAYSTFGVSESISREIPFYRAKGEHERAEFMKDVIISFSLLTASLISIGLVIWALAFKSSLRPELTVGLLIMAGMVVLQRVSNLHIAFLRAYKHFQFAGKQMVVSSLMNSILVIFFTRQFAMHGFMWAMCFSFIFNIVWIRIWHPFKFSWKLDWKAVWDMMKYGFPLMIAAFLGSLFLSIDKIMIAKFLGLRELGIYSLATMAYIYICNVPNSVGIVLIPNFHEKYGENETPEALRGYLLKSSQGFSDLMPILIAGIWCFAPCLAQKVLPDFRESIPPMKVLVLSAYFLSLIHPFQYFLAVLRKQKSMIPIVAAACALAFGVNFIALKSGYGLMGVSVSTVIVFWIKFTCVYTVSASNVFSAKERWNLYGLFLLKFFYLVGVAYFIEKYFSNPSGSFMVGTLQFGIFFLAFLQFLIKLSRDLQLISALKKKFSFLKPEVVKNEVDG